MPNYTYKAKKPNAETVTGQIAAPNHEEAVEMVIRQGLVPFSVEERRGSGQALMSSSPEKVRPRSLYLFSHQLVSLLKGGVSLLRALDIIQEQTQDPQLKDVVLRIASLVRDGSTFSDALTAYPRIFDPLYIAMVKVGEESGNLKEVLKAVAQHQRAQQELASKVKGALVYPALMALVGAATVVFILTFVMPRIAGLISNMGQQLPWPTQVLLKLTSTLQNSWLGVLAVIAVGGLLLEQTFKTNAGKTWLSHIVMHLPVVGPFLLKADIARFTRTLELLLKSGISLIRAWQVATPVLNNRLLRDEFSKCQTEITSGNSLANSMKNLRFVPVMVSHLVAVGEESGTLSDALGDIADSYEQQTEESVKVATTLLEPLMILAIGVVIGFLVLAMLLPVFQMDVLAR